MMASIGINTNSVAACFSTGNCTLTNMPERMLASVLSNAILTKYWPPVFLADELTSMTLPFSVWLMDFTKTLTSVSFLICDISVSGTLAMTSKFPGVSILIKGTPGFAISPASILLLVTVPLKGAVILL